jgi:type IV secretion system protein VirD4
MIPQYRETDGLGRRRLLTPDEILRFPNDELLIVIRGENVLRAKKFDYIYHPYAKSLIPASIFDYHPRSENNHAPQAEIAQKDSQTGNNTSNMPQENAKPKLYQSSKPPQEF